MLSKKGHDVVLFTKSNLEIKTFISKMRSFASLFRTSSVEEELEVLVKNYKPHIFHIHNTFPLISSGAFKVAKRHNIPVVMTLHNYRLIYPNGLLLDNKNEIDLRTIEQTALVTVGQKVYRNSFLLTLILAVYIEFHRKRKTFKKNVDQAIALSLFSREIFLKANVFNKNQITVKPNFLESHIIQPKPIDSKEGFIFVGRLSEEKGILYLLEIWEKNHIPYPLNIVGSGPLENVVREFANRNTSIHYMGFKNRDEIFEIISCSRCLIFPSIWYETFGLTIIEAFSVGTTVLCSKLGGQAELVHDGKTGLLFDLNCRTNLLDHIEKLASDNVYLSGLSKNALSSFHENYSEEINYDQLMDVYKNAIKITE